MDAREIMSTDVVSLTPEMSVREAGDALLRFRIHGAPVIDADEQLVGMVSLMDLVGRPGIQVADVMTADPITASEDNSVEEVAGLMLDQMVRRIPITSGGRVIGIVSASDIIQVFLNLHEDSQAAETAAAGSRPRLAVGSARPA